MRRDPRQGPPKSRTARLARGYLEPRTAIFGRQDARGNQSLATWPAHRRQRSDALARRSFLDQYEVRQVGGQTILEYWIPAEDLDALNASIVGTIKVIAEFH